MMIPAYPGGERFRTPLGAGDKVGQRTELPRRGCPYKVQPWNGRSEPIAKIGIAIQLANLFDELRGKKAVARDVDAIAGAHQHMIDSPFAAVIENELDLATNFFRA